MQGRVEEAEPAAGYKLRRSFSYRLGARAAVVPRRLHCTLTLSEASAFNVNVQDGVLLPPLEHAPDQIALLPLETLRVMLVPCANDACAELPTRTLMPAGLDVTVSPVRPVAETVSVTVADGDGGGVPLTANFVMKASPQKISCRPLKTRSKAPAVVGKSA